MKERPILFNASMVRAILDGRKSQTRRIVSPKPDKFGFWRYNSTAKCDDCGDHYRRAPKRCKCGCTLFKSVEYPIQKCLSECPFGQSGDRLWVRETWGIPYTYVDEPEVHKCDVMYRANPRDESSHITWRPSIHMPRCFSRITLEITAVRVERVMDIRRDDVLAEGIAEDELRHHGWFWKPYMLLWESTNGKGSWNQNPWVWVIEFKRVTP